MNSLKNELEDRPDVRKREKMFKKIDERARIEEKTFNRFQLTKSDKKDINKVKHRFQKNQLNDFSDLNDLKNVFGKRTVGNAEERSKRIKKKKSKGKGKGKGKKKWTR